jgi:hypothetical protein
VIEELEDKDIYVSSYDAGGRHFTIDNLKLPRLQMEWHPHRLNNDAELCPQGHHPPRQPRRPHENLHRLPGELPRAVGGTGSTYSTSATASGARRLICIVKFKVQHNLSSGIPSRDYARERKNHRHTICNQSDLSHGPDRGHKSGLRLGNPRAQTLPHSCSSV